MNIVFGSEGHAREIAFILKENGQQADLFVDRESRLVSGNISCISELQFFNTYQDHADLRFFVGIGDPVVRKAVVEKISSVFPAAVFPNLWHPSALVQYLRMGQGNIFFPGFISTIDIELGNHNHFNSHSSVSHDCRIGNFNTISPGARLAGNVRLGDLNFIGLNAAVIERRAIGDGVVVGAGATVVKDIPLAGVYMGLPAKPKQ